MKIKELKKWKLLFAGMCCIAQIYLICGCSRTVKTGIAEGRINGMMEELKQDQIDFLQNQFVNGEQIAQGNLNDAQKDALAQYDFVMEYLADKYPDYKIRVVDADLYYKDGTASSTFRLMEENNTDKYYELLLRGGEGEYTATDNFFAHLLNEEFADAFHKLLKENGINCYKVWTSISYSLDEDENVKAEDILNGTTRVMQDTVVYIDLEDMDGSAENIMEHTKNVLDELAIYGTYTVAIEDNGERILDADVYER